MNPYVAGLLLGLTLLAAYLILGAGLGASSAIARLGAYLELTLAPARTLASDYFGRWGEQPLKYYLVFMMGGVFFGGLVSALLARRCDVKIERGQNVRRKSVCCLPWRAVSSPASPAVSQTAALQGKPCPVAPCCLREVCFFSFASLRAGTRPPGL